MTQDGALVEEYRYDGNGNRISETNARRGIPGRTLTHSIEDHIITAGPIRYEFDLDDNLAARVEGGETTEYLYATTGELLEVTLPDGREISYVNDPLGRRIAKRVNGVVVEKYLWSGLTTLLAVYDANDQLRQRFVYADDRLPYAMTSGSTTYYLHYDQVGTLRLVTDQNGAIIKRIDYDSFGNILSDSNPAFPVPFGFAGGLHDRDTGLVRFGYRDYLPEIGKWTVKDPILFAGGDANLFGYVQNDPVHWVDPWGLFLDGINAGGDFGGHSDFFGHDRFDYTKEDHGVTQPFIQPWRHFRDLINVEKDLAKAIKSHDKDAMERLMHQGQDYFSHYDRGYRWFPVGHILDGSRPDTTTWQAWESANRWTQDWVKKWNSQPDCH